MSEETLYDGSFCLWEAATGVVLHTIQRYVAQ